MPLVGTAIVVVGTLVPTLDLPALSTESPSRDRRCRRPHRRCSPRHCCSRRRF